jgi:hypothetical protein
VSSGGGGGGGLKCDDHHTLNTTAGAYYVVMAGMPGDSARNLPAFTTNTAPFASPVRRDTIAWSRLCPPSVGSRTAARPVVRLLNTVQSRGQDRRRCRQRRSGSRAALLLVG